MSEGGGRVSAMEPRKQHNPGVHVYMREAIEALREQRDAHGNKADPYDKLTIVASNLRDAYEWLFPLLWRDDPEFVPFAERKAPRW